MTRAGSERIKRKPYFRRVAEGKGVLLLLSMHKQHCIGPPVSIHTFGLQNEIQIDARNSHMAVTPTN